MSDSEVSLIPQLNSSSLIGTEDGITKNLAFLRFDVGTEEADINLLYLRKRSHMQTINIISHAVFFTAITGEIKKRACLKVDKEACSMKVGIVGFGRLGLHLLNSLIEYARIHPDNIKVSTRRPDSMLADIAVKGVDSFFDNAKAVKNMDIVFLCCPPQQADTVLREIKGHVKCLVYSVIAGLTTSKISEVLESMKVFKPLYDNYKKEAYNEYMEWDYKASICEALALNHIKKMTCPLQRNQIENSVEIRDSIIHCLFLNSINMCLDHLLTLEESVNVCNKVLFRDMIGFTFKAIEKLTKTTVYNNDRFKLIEYISNEKYAMSMETSKNFHKNFMEHYKTVFDRFCDWTIF